jgi:hypothetical protein
MASIEDLRRTIASIFGRMTNPTPPGNFFESRITRTPGIVTPLPGASAMYKAEINPEAAVVNSALDATTRNELAKLWQGKDSGMIVTNPDMPQRALRHEEVHGIWDKAGLGSNYQQISPVINPAWAQTIATDPMYKGINPQTATNEAAAYQLTTDKSTQLANYIADILSSKGKVKEAKQIKELAK